MNCNGCGREFGTDPGHAKRRWATQNVCDACTRWLERHPGQTLVERRRGIRNAVVRSVAVDSPHWRLDADCREVDASLFEWNEDETQGHRHTREHVDVVELFCRDCPVRAQCLADAEQNPHYSLGVRGGIYFTWAGGNTAVRRVDLLKRAEVHRAALERQKALQAARFARLHEAQRERAKAAQADAGAA